MNGALAKLREITDQMERSPELEEIISSKSYVEVETEIGEPVMIFHLQKDKYVAVCKAICWAGSVLKRHSHPETEVMTVYYGLMVIEYDDGETVTVGEKTVITIPPGKPHRVSFPENCKLIAITMPPAKGYPDDEGTSKEHMGRSGPAGRIGTRKAG